MGISRREMESDEYQQKMREMEKSKNPSDLAILVSHFREPYSSHWTVEDEYRLWFKILPDIVRIRSNYLKEILQNNASSSLSSDITLNRADNISLLSEWIHFSGDIKQVQTGNFGLFHRHGVWRASVEEYDFIAYIEKQQTAKIGQAKIVATSQSIGEQAQGLLQGVLKWGNSLLKKH